MKVSINHIRALDATLKLSEEPAPNGVSELIEKIGAQLGAVEETIDIGKRYVGVLVVKVVSCEDHPNADRLHVCKVDDGGKAENVERDENGHVQVVCGAPNVRAGILVAWLPPGSTVPSTIDTEPFIMEARNLRGVISNGMLASPKELSIGDSHDGILEVDDDSVAPGTPFAEAYDLTDDVVIDMENKMFTHRPDCFGILGIAREIAGIQQQAFTSPRWYKSDVQMTSPDGPLRVEVQNELPELVPRFIVLPMSGITIKPSPVWLQVDLARLGIRPINNIVDLTNYYMVLTGQPLHAYDYDKVVAQDANADHATLVVRYPKAGEKIRLLSGKEVEPREEAIMIATRDHLIGVGGVMGGGDTEVDDSTKNIILECANFNMYSIRRTSMANGIFTDAVTRFNKGQSPLQNLAVLARIATDVTELAGGQVAGTLVDDNHLSPEILKRGSLEAPVLVDRQFINARLGFDLSAEEIAVLLRNVEFNVMVEGDNLTVTAPFWRTDIAIREDIVEEVGRLYGFDHLPLQLPKHDLTPASKDALLELKARLRRTLSQAGANEVLSYNFVHGKSLEKVGQNPEDSFRLSNAISPELQYYRMSLTPSLLEKVHPNIKAGYDHFALFEINKTHSKVHGQDEEGLPKEIERLGLIITASAKKAGSAMGASFYEAKKYIEYIAKQFGIELAYEPLAENPGTPVTQPFDWHRSALIVVKGTDKTLGIVGEYREQVLKNLKLPAYTAGFEIGLEYILELANTKVGYVAVPKFPKIEQDICLRVNTEVSYKELAGVVMDSIQTAVPQYSRHSVNPIDIYSSPEDPSHKQVTFRVSVASYRQTMTDQELSTILSQVSQAAKASLGAETV